MIMDNDFSDWKTLIDIRERILKEGTECRSTSKLWRRRKTDNGTPQSETE